MNRSVKLLFAAATALTLFGVQPLQAKTNDFTFTNNMGKTVRICGNDSRLQIGSTPIPGSCKTLKNREYMRYQLPRGGSRVNVRIYNPGFRGKRLCTFNDVAPGQYLIKPTGWACRLEDYPASKPEPKPEPPRPRPPSKAQLRVCNDNNERVYFAVGYLVNDRDGTAVEGWWYVEPNGCYNVDIGKRIAKLQRPSDRAPYRGAVMIYGETKFELLNPVQKVWPTQGRTTNRHRHCINTNKDRSFTILGGYKTAARKERWSTACNARGGENVWMDVSLGYRVTGDTAWFSYTFRGND